MPDNELTPRVAKAMKKLGGWFNPTASARVNRASCLGILEHDKSGRDDHAETANIMIDCGHQDLSPDFEITHTIQEKSVHEDPNEKGTKIKVVDYDNLIKPKKYLKAWNHPEPFQRKK